MLTATLTTMMAMASALLLVNGLPIIIAPTDGVSSSPEAAPLSQMIIQFSLPDPLLDDCLPLPQLGRSPSSTEQAALINIHSTSSSESLDINIDDGLDVNYDRFAFDLHPSSLSPYHSLVDAVYRAFNSILNTFDNIFSLLKYYHEDSSTFSTPGGNAALYEGLQPMTLEEEFGDVAIYPNALDYTHKDKKYLRKVESWIKFDKMMDAFMSGSSNSPSTEKKTRTSPPTKKSPFHRGIKDAVRQA